MANTTALKRRIGSIKNTKQITKAMELVAASKMRRAQEQALASRDYREAADSIIDRLSTVTDLRNHPLFVRRPVKRRLVIAITSDQGLAGAYDGNILKLLTATLQEDETKKIKTEVVTIGKKGAQFASRLENVVHAGVFPMFGTSPNEADVRAIIDPVLARYVSEDIDAVQILYTGFVSQLRQEARSIELLPSVLPQGDEKKVSALEVAIFEPSIEDIVGEVVERLLLVQLWQFLLESLASEHSMRMMAMKNASDNAGDIIDDLTLEFNTVRQAAITQEIAEIVGGAEAVSKSN
jgi:F-type H+-transporting ATPase subunit gamma